MSGVFALMPTFAGRFRGRPRGFFNDWIVRFWRRRSSCSFEIARFFKYSLSSAAYLVLLMKIFAESSSSDSWTTPRRSGSQMGVSRKWMGLWVRLRSSGNPRCRQFNYCRSTGSRDQYSHSWRPLERNEIRIL